MLLSRQASGSEKRACEEAAKRPKLEAEGRSEIIPKLRIESRQKYLEKRNSDIIDDEYVPKGSTNWNGA
jgi:pre-mRNA-splicing factor ATP-dependent RNA helicase DHX16